MPRFCGVINCGSRGDRDKKSFFRIPAALSKGGEIKMNLSRERRQKWIAALKRADLNELKLKYLWICEDHFISGKPADLHEVDNPDWIPSKNLGYSKDNSPCLKKRFEHIKKKKLAVQELVDGPQETNQRIAHFPLLAVSVGTQTDLTMHDLDNLINASVDVIYSPRCKRKKV